MAITKRVTAPDDSDRLAQNLFNFNPSIRDRQSFDIAYEDYLKDTPEAIRNKRLRQETWQDMIVNNPRINRKSLHKEAGGKDLKRDRQTTAKTVVTTEKEYIRRGATKVDLENYDTVSTNKRGDILFAKKVNVTIKGKTQTRYRDAKGRYVKPRRK